MIGQVINNYVLERKLGEGGMGDVYLARHNRIDRTVAIKILHRNLFANEGIRNRFKNEANALIRLSHPHIVKIYDYVEQDDFACLIVEYIDGVTLDEYIMRVTGPLPGTKATGIICPILEAVQYAHDNGIFHRDIKPGNIMVSRDGRMVRVMDFGIAKLAGGISLKITHAQAQLGTPFYMSPEQVKGISYTAQSDIYSLGVTLFEMVTGKCPYLEITNLFELQTKIVSEPLPPTANYYPDVPSRIQQAIAIATHKLPEQRFKSCSEFKMYLQKEDKTRPASLPEPVQIQPENPRPVKIEKTKPQHKSQQIVHERKKSNAWIYILSFLLLAITGLVAYYFSAETQTVPPVTGTDSIPHSGGDTVTVPPNNHPDTPVIKAPVPVPPIIKNNTGEQEPNTTIITDTPTVTDLPDPPSEKRSQGPTQRRVFSDLIGQKLCDGRVLTGGYKVGKWRPQPEDSSGNIVGIIEFSIPGGGTCSVNVTYSKNDEGEYVLNKNIIVSVLK